MGLVVAACSGADHAASSAPQEAAPAARPNAEPTAGATPQPTSQPAATVTPVAEPTALPLPKLIVEAAGLPALAGLARYEAWLIVDGELTTAGTFVDFDGGVVLDAPSVDVATAVVITIETDDDPAPSPTHFLAGSLVDGSATLTATDPAAIGLDFSTSTGQYILATPTDGAGAPENEGSGVWWTFITRAQSLVLPQLPDGWVYEGWQVIDEIPFSTGTFVSQFGVADNAAPYSGLQPGPPFPGEDFLMNAPDGLEFARDLRGTEVVITVEPFPDTDPGPFPLVVLEGLVPADAVDHVSYAVDNISADFPSGMATVSR